MDCEGPLIYSQLLVSCAQFYQINPVSIRVLFL
jgi:hypothetical protein